LIKKIVHVFCLYYFIFLFESNRKHHTIKRGGLDEINGDILHTSEESFGFWRNIFLGVFYETGSSFGQPILPPKSSVDTGLVLTNTGIGYRASSIIFGVRFDRHRRNLLQLRFGSVH
jgi:hypothetical protein